MSASFKVATGKFKITCMARAQFLPGSRCQVLPGFLYPPHPAPLPRTAEEARLSSIPRMSSLLDTSVNSRTHPSHPLSPSMPTQKSQAQQLSKHSHVGASPECSDLPQTPLSVARGIPITRFSKPGRPQTLLAADSPGNEDELPPVFFAPTPARL